MGITRSTKRYRPAALLAAAGLLALAGPAWPAAADTSSSPSSSAHAAAAAARPAPMSEAEMESELGKIREQMPGGKPAPDPKNLNTKKVDCVTRGSESAKDIPTIPWAQQVMRLPQLWSFSQQGKGQKIGVVDTGVSQHDRLGGRLIAGGDAIDQAGDGTQDCDGHGTLVAGIIAASGDGSSFTGVAPQATVVSVRTTSSHYQNAQGGAGTALTMAEGIVSLVDRGDVKVINISQAACVDANPNLAYEFQIRQLQAAVKFATAKNIVVVSAAGNVDNSTKCKKQNSAGNLQMIVAPAWFDDDVLTVGSVDANGDASTFSVAGPWVDVAAPGQDITSLDPSGSGLVNQVIDPQSGKPSPEQGTSFAAPYVTGLAALLRQRYPDLSAKQVMHRIIATAQHPAGNNGRNDQLGYGLIDPVAAMTAVLPEERGGKPAQSGPVFRPIPAPPKADKAPTIVALSGAGAGLGLLGLTMFVMYTVNRNRRVV
jgi:membrane-anchored mycosin MYCP